jgi:hypothetical protein
MIIDFNDAASQRPPDQQVPTLLPDPEAAGGFLDSWASLTGAPRHTLVKIVPDARNCTGRTFAWPDHRDDALRWITASNDHANVYYAVNIAREVHKKPLKSDVETLVAVHVDVDPRKGLNFGTERARVLALAGELAERPDPPTFIIDSGGGIQALYIASDPAAVELEYLDQVEDLNRRLGAALGDDGTTWNADRILRVPGTVNHPDRRKRENGQPPALARLLSSTGEVQAWHDIKNAIERLEKEPPAHAAPRQRDERSRPNGHDRAADAGGELPPYATDADLEALFAAHPHLEAPWRKTSFNRPVGASDSEWDYRWVAELARVGIEPAQIASFLRAFRAYHAPEKAKQDRADYIWRTVRRAVDKNPPSVRVEDLAEPEPQLDPEPEPADLRAPGFHGALGEMVRALDPLTEADPHGILASVLVMLGNWAGRRYHLSVGADRHYAAQQLVLIGTSALARKGTAIGLAKAAMRVFDPSWATGNVFHALNSGQGIAHTVAQLSESTSQTDLNHDRRALFVIEEFADVLRKSQQKENTIMQVLRLAWDGAVLENTSITRKIRVAGATVSMIAAITDSELRQLLDPAELATGSYNRMNFVTVSRSKVLPGFPPEIGEEHFAAMKTIRERIDALPGQYAIAPDCISLPITLDPEAKAAAVEIKRRWETDGKNLVEQANSRAFMHILRYALIYAIADGFKYIRVAHLEAAEDLVKRMAAGMHQQATGGLSDSIAQRIITHMKEDPGEALSRTGISCEVFSRNVPARDLENAIRTLTDLGWLQVRQLATSGRPRTVYALVPWATN